ncbi:MAG: chorismate mutase [Candidatus Altiarchaeales archaeon]|nr:chorismate mutase [Candidatus Altiarchaeales archaeon]
MTCIRDLRTEIDEVDRRMLALLEKRFSLTKKIGEIKRKQQKPIYDSEREKQVLGRLSTNTDLDSCFVEKIFKQIIAFCRENE